MSHGGSFHSGSFRPGGFHSGGFRAGGAPSGSFRPGAFHANRFHDGRFHNHGLFPGYFYGYPFYNFYPSYGYDVPYDLGYGLDPGPMYSDSYSGAAPLYSSAYQALEPYSTVSRDAASVQAVSTAHVTVRVPANATLWFNGSLTTSTGSVREFQSPSLSPGRYTYAIRARWTENGRDITQTQQVAVSPGADMTVDFPTSSRITVLPGSP
jgi:uncharacterized protein (TIGR03000 family)